MFATLRRDFALVWTASTISVVGDWMLLVALPFHLYEVTGSTLAAGALFATSALPTLLFGSVAGVFVDRWDRRRTMIVVDALRGAVVLLLLAVQSSDWLWVVYVASFVQASLGQFFGPARNAFIPSLVPAEELTAANALDGLSIQTVGLVAPALGGALTAGFGLAPVILLDSASFLVSAALIAMVRTKGSAPVSQGDNNQATAGLAAWDRVWGELRDGLVVVRRERAVWAVFLVVSLAWLGQGIINALIVPFVKDVLGGNAQMFGWTYTAQAVGGVLGGLLVGQLTGRIRPAQAMIVGGLGVGLVFLAIVNLPRFLVQAGVPPWPVVLTLYAVGGVAVMALFIPHITLLQQNVPDRFQGRVFATLSTATTVATVLGLGIGGIAGLAIGPVPLLSLAAVLYGLGGIAALLVPNRGLLVMT